MTDVDGAAVTASSQTLVPDQALGGDAGDVFSDVPRQIRCGAGAVFKRTCGHPPGPTRTVGGALGALIVPELGRRFAVGWAALLGS
jgi:hypothetical protein